MFTYTVDDGHGDTDSATVLVTVDKDVAGPVAIAPLQRFPGQTLGTSSARVRISWSASDPGSGVTRYLLQVSVNGGTFKTVVAPEADDDLDRPDARLRPDATGSGSRPTTTRATSARMPTVRRSDSGRYEEIQPDRDLRGRWSKVKRTAGHRRGGSLHERRRAVRDAHDDRAGHRPVVTRSAGSGHAADLHRRGPGRDREPPAQHHGLPPADLLAALRRPSAATPSGWRSVGDGSRRARRLRDPALSDRRLRFGRRRTGRRSCYTARALSGRP